MRKAMMVGLAAAALTCAQAEAADKKALYFVVNGASDFWKSAEAGLKKAQSELPNYTLPIIQQLWAVLQEKRISQNPIKHNLYKHPM